MLSLRDLLKHALPATTLLVLVAGPTQSVRAEVLQGGVQKEDAFTRLARPDGPMGGNANVNVPMRLQRPMTAPPIGNSMKGLVDTTAFSAPLRGNAAQDDPHFGLLKPSEFNPANSKFDLGTDRNSRELTLAWEAWHKQLSKEIYKRWSDVATVPGAATLRLTVSREHTVTPVMVKSSGNRMFDDVLISTVMTLNGNPGLTFPSKSERRSVSFEADYVAATDIQPGYSWVKNDVEKVRQDY